MTLSGFWYGEGSSNRLAAEFSVSADGSVNVVDSQTGATILATTFDQLIISDRIGNTPRFLSKQDQGRFETSDNDGVDAILLQLRPAQSGSVAHILESRWRYALLSVVGVIAFGWWFAVHGTPTVANWISLALPKHIISSASEENLLLLDELYFDESELSHDVQIRIQTHFADLIAQHSALDIRVMFRKGNALGANAFALPDGSIIFTDEIVNLSESDDELLAILAHEIGHVVERHGVRSVVQGSILSLATLLMFGDAGAAAESLLTIPVLLTQFAYSRDFEFEADRYSSEQMAINNVDPNHFVNIMRSLSRDGSCIKTNTCGDNNDDDQDNRLLDYLSTHPAPEDRIRHYQEHSQAF